MKYKNNKCAILGFGIEGRDVFKYLSDNQATIAVFDKNDKDQLDLSDIDTQSVNFFTGDKYLHGGLKDFDVIFRSPGVYRYLPQIIEAEKKGCEISSATRIFFNMCPATIIGVTGTKGKGTTSALIYEILKNSGKKVFLAGNMGKPCLELLPRLNSNCLVVLELSSFQLIDLDKSPHFAVVLNITEDHLDWHKDREEYVAAKENIVKFQNNSDIAILNADYENSIAFAKLTPANKYYFSRRKKVSGCFVKKNEIYLNVLGKEVEIGSTQDLQLKGQHNWENICAAVCASYLAGANLESIRKVVFSFKGLEHRLELVKEVNKVKYYDDSFSTNPQTTIAAINSFDEPTTLILGGFDKRLDYSKMTSEIVKKTNVNNCILIGDISEQIEEALRKSGYKNTIIKMGYASMNKIIKKCFDSTPMGGVVLLSPATSSFDMFENYKIRGEEFKKAVLNLK